MLSYIMFIKNFILFKGLCENTNRGLPLRWKDKYPCLNDNTNQTEFDRHYVYHQAWASRILARVSPALHVDIGSSLFFCTQVSAYTHVDFYDYRPPELYLPNLECKSADLCALPFGAGSMLSISCMHVVEHVGLGRYGDFLDPDGDLKAIAELQRVLAVGGNLLFVVPIGKPRIMFNAHRIYSYSQIISYFPELILKEFALIPDNSKDGGLVQNASEKMADAQSYGCGCFWFSRIS